MYLRLTGSENAVFPTDISPQSALSWKVVSFFLHVTAVSAGVYRLWQRFRTHRAWWDDYVLFFPLVLDIFYAISFWFSVPQLPEQESDENVSYALLVLNSYWFTRFIFIVIVWSSRIVLGLSLARLFPKRSRPRMWSMCIVVITASFLVASIVVSATTCNRKTILLLANEETDCVRSIAGIPLEDVFLFAGDIVGDTLLVLCPIYWFWKIRLPPKERRLILLTFCGNVLTLLSAIVFLLISNFAVLKDDVEQYLFHVGMPHIAAAISLFVCNFAVVMGGLYRLLRRHRHSESVPTTTTIVSSNTPPSGTSLPTESYPLTQFSTSPTSERSLPTPLTLTDISSFSSTQPSFTGESADVQLDSISTGSFMHDKPHSAEG